MGRLENKVAVVTGAGSGIGAAIAEQFCIEGCRIIATDINATRLDELRNHLAKQGAAIVTILADMADEAAIESMIQAAVDNYGRIDILVNNAGIMDHFEPAGSVDNATWEKVMQVNLTGPLKAMRTALRYFLPQGNGNIINIASIGGLEGARAGAAYTASKHALVGLTRNTGYMYAKLGIRCNAIAPGAVYTHIADDLDLEHLDTLVNERIMPGMALNPRSGKPSEIAAAALFLACDESSFINASVLTADGGWSAY